MKTSLLWLACAASLSGPLMAHAATVEEQIVAELTASGYTDIQIYHTWLGRLRIVAQFGADSRELVIMPTTGEVLRDHATGPLNGDVLPPIDMPLPPDGAMPRMDMPPPDGANPRPGFDDFAPPKGDMPDRPSGPRGGGRP